MSSDTPELDKMIEQLDAAIETTSDKVESGRVYDAENERTRIKWLRALAYLIRTKRKVVEDKELEEIHERLDRIEDREGIN